VQRYRVELERAPAKALTDLPRADQRRIVARLDALATDPRPPGVVKLAGTVGYRVRQGDYRIVYVVDDGLQVVTVTRIAHRKQVYRRR
jgi:mRNA interferase RelE/StbE